VSTFAKSILAMSFILGTFSVANANENPWKRVCRQNNGVFWVLNVQTPNEIPLCVFGEAAIGAETFFNHKLGNETQAVEAYNRNAICRQYDGRRIQGTDTDRKTWTVCVMADGSYIELNTLDRGMNSPLNALLNQAL